MIRAAVFSAHPAGEMKRRRFAPRSCFPNPSLSNIPDFSPDPSLSREEKSKICVFAFLYQISG